MARGYVHAIDPVMLSLGGADLYWYGAAYSFGFAVLWGWLALRRRGLGWSARDVAEASLLFILCVLAGGRLVDAVFYEWDWFRDRPLDLPRLWTGGLASHGLFAGAAAAALLICWRTGTPLLRLLDELAVPAAVIFGFGRIGNFIEGGVIGTPTDLPWGVLFPGAPEFRHPVALYDGAKNLALVPLLVAVLRRRPAGSGHAAAQFLLWYGLLRFAVDQFRDYESVLLRLGPGQWMNLGMALLGALLWRSLRRHPRRPAPPAPRPERPVGAARALLLAAAILFPLSIPTSWVRDHIAALRAEANGPVAASPPNGATTTPPSASPSALQPSPLAPSPAGR